MSGIFTISHLSERGIGEHRNRTDLVRALARQSGRRIVAFADASVRRNPRNLRLLPAINLCLAFPWFRDRPLATLVSRLWIVFFTPVRVVYVLFGFVSALALGLRSLLIYWPTSIENCWLALLLKQILKAKVIIFLNGFLELDGSIRVRVNYRLMMNSGVVFFPTPGTVEYYESRRRLRLVNDHARTVTIDNPIPESRSLLSLSKDMARRATGLPRDSKIVLSVARWDPIKGLNFTIEVARRLAQHNGVFTVFIGAKSIEEERRAFLAQLQAIPNTSVLEDVPYVRVPYYMRAADILIMTSVVGNFNQTFLEAVVNGLRVVSFEAGLSEVNVGGLLQLVRNGDVDAMSKVVVSALGQPSLTINEVEPIRRRFSTDRIAKRMLAFM